MSDKQVLLDGHYLNPATGLSETLNVLLANNQLVGLGYVPDEDEESIQKKSIKGAYIVSNPMGVSFDLLDPSSLPRVSELLISRGYTHFSACVSHADVSELLSVPQSALFSPFTYLKDVEGRIVECSQLKQQGVCGFVHSFETDKDWTVFQEGIIACSLLELPIVMPVQTDSFDFEKALNLFNDLNGYKLHFSGLDNRTALEAILKYNQSRDRVSVGVPASKVNDKNFIDALKGLFESPLAFCFEYKMEDSESLSTFLLSFASTMGLSLAKVVSVLSEAPFSCFGLSYEGFGLYSRPCFSVCRIDPEESTEQVFIKGACVYDTST